MRFVCMAIPKRAHIVNYLKLHIPGLEVVWDKHRSARLTWMSVLECIGKDPAVVVEDDIVLTQGFYNKVLWVIEGHPNDLIQFHSRTRDDLTIGSRYRAGSSFYNNQALYYPPGMAKKFLEYADGNPRWEIDPNGYDRLMAEYMQKKKMRYWNHVPSLCDHLPITSEIDPRRSKNRRSTTFKDPETEGLGMEVLPAKAPKKRKGAI